MLLKRGPQRAQADRHPTLASASYALCAMLRQNTLTQSSQL